VCVCVFACVETVNLSKELKMIMNSKEIKDATKKLESTLIRMLCHTRIHTQLRSEIVSVMKLWPASYRKHFKRAFKVAKCS